MLMLENLVPAPKIETPKEYRPAFEFDGNEGWAQLPPTAGVPSFDDFLEQQGFDPSEFEVIGSPRTSRWQRYDGEWLSSYRFNFRRKVSNIDLPLLYLTARKGINKNNKSLQVAKTDKALVVCWSDTQTGKANDIRGGTKELIERIAEKQQKVEQHLKRNKYDEIVFFNVGDSIEGFESGGNPMRTNDLSLMEQIDLEATFEFEMLKMLTKYAPVRAASIASNHCAWRSGKLKLGTPNDDWGIFIQRQLARLSSELDLPIKFFEPQAHDESLALDLWGDGEMILGLVHGHQASRPDGIAQWWRNQSHGNQAVKEADLLIHGHFHHLTVKESGRRGNHSRWIVQCPTLDAGSSWFRNGMGGDDSDPGLLIIPLERGQNFTGTVYKL